MKKAWTHVCLKRVVPCCLFAALLGVGQALAATTYYFAMDSAANGRSGGDGSDVPATDPVFQYARAAIAGVLVTLSDPAAGGTLDYREDVHDGTTTYLRYDAAGLTVNSLAAGGSYWGSLRINHVGQPECGAYYCSIDASLKDLGGGLFSGWLHLYGVYDDLWLEESGGLWTGFIGSDDPGKFYPYAWGLTLGGHWREVPLPGTLVLLGSGVLGLGVTRWRTRPRSETTRPGGRAVA